MSECPVRFEEYLPLCSLTIVLKIALRLMFPESISQFDFNSKIIIIKNNFQYEKTGLTIPPALLMYITYIEGMVKTVKVWKGDRSTSSSFEKCQRFFLLGFGSLALVE